MHLASKVVANDRGVATVFGVGRVFSEYRHKGYGFAFCAKRIVLTKLVVLGGVARYCPMVEGVEVWIQFSVLVYTLEEGIVCSNGE